MEEIVAIESDEESSAQLVIDDQAEGMPEQSAGTGPAVQSTSANRSATPKGVDVRTPMEVEEEAEVGMAMEVSVPTPEDLGMAVASTPTPTPDHTYSTIVSAPTPIPILTTANFPMPTPAPIYSTLITTSPLPATLLPICDAITDTLRYALWQRPNPTLLTQQTTLVQSAMSEQGPI